MSKNRSKAAAKPAGKTVSKAVRKAVSKTVSKTGAKKMRLVFEAQDLLGFIALLQEGRASQLLAPFDVSKSQYTVLFLMSQEPERAWTMTELAEHMAMQLPGISKIVGQLLDAGLLSREPSAEDKRKKLVRITKAGYRKHTQVLAAMEPEVAGVFAEWSVVELQSFNAHLLKLRGWLERDRDAALAIDN